MSPADQTTLAGLLVWVGQALVNPGLYVAHHNGHIHSILWMHLIRLAIDIARLADAA